jgi:hypothetical protein
MRRTKALPSLIVFTVACVVFGIVHVGYAQSPDADVFAVIKVNNLQELLPAITQFVDQFQPGMGGMVNPMMVGNMVFNNPDWAGMDMAGEYTAVVLNPMKYPQDPFALLLPITNKDEYLGALSQSLTGGEEMDGIYSFTRPTQKAMFLTFTGDTGIMSDNQEIAAQVKMLVESNSLALQEAPAVKGQLQAFLALDKILVSVRPMLDMLKQQMLMGMQMGMQQGMQEEGEGDQPNPAEGISNIVQAEFDIMLSLLEQIKSLQLGIAIGAEGLRLSKAAFPVQGTAMEKFLAAQTPKKAALLGHIPADSAIIASTTLNFTPEFIEGYLGFIRTMSSTPGVDPAIIDKSVETARQYFEIVGEDTVAGLFSQTDETLLTAVYAIKDAAKAKEVLEQYPELFNSFAGLYKNMGFDMSLSLADQAEVTSGEILNYNFGMNAEMIPDPEAQEMFNKVFGDNLTMPIGLTGNYAVAGLGKNARPQVEKLMGALDSGAETAAQQTPSMFGLPEENNMFMYISVPKILAWAAKIFPEAPPFEIVEGPGLAMASQIVDSHVEAELYLPVEEIQVIQNMIMQAQMQQMQGPEMEMEEPPTE